MRRILVVANQTVGGAQFTKIIEQRVAEADCAFYVVVPATAVSDQIVSPGGPASSTKAPSPREHARAVAEQRLDAALAAIRGAGGEAEGEVGEPDPLEAVRDVIGQHKVDEVIVSTLPLGLSKWLRRNLPRQVERLTGLPVTHVENEEVGRKWDVVFIEWNAVSAAARVSDGIDTFVFADDGIRVQTLRYTLEPT